MFLPFQICQKEIQQETANIAQDISSGQTLIFAQEIIYATPNYNLH